MAAIAKNFLQQRRDAVIKLGHVEITPKIKELVNEVLESGNIGQSDMIERFEQAFAKWVGKKYAIAVSSGTMADTVALATLKYFNPGKEQVIVPALTFIAQINSIYYNHLKPVFVDVDNFGLMDMMKVPGMVTKNTLCLFPTPLLGQPLKFPNFEDKTVPIIQDSCEAMGSDGCTHGAMATFSFFPSHTLTTGEGGMIVTDDKDYAERAKRLRNHGKTSDLDFHFDAIGFNAKMSSLQAAVGLGMLENINSIIERKRLAFKFLGGFEEKIAVSFYSTVVPHGVPIIADSKEQRDGAMERLRRAGIECRNMFSCIPTQEKAYEFLGYKPGDFPEAERIGDCGFYVPCHGGMTAKELLYLRDVLEYLRTYIKFETADKTPPEKSVFHSLATL